MKVRKLTDGEEIQVGDYIRAEHMGIGGKSHYKVHRVTKRYAFVRYNDVAEGKYPRVYVELGFVSLPRQQWCTTTYSAWRPV